MSTKASTAPAGKRKAKSRTERRHRRGSPRPTSSGREPRPWRDRRRPALRDGRGPGDRRRRVPGRSCHGRSPGVWAIRMGPGHPQNLRRFPRFHRRPQRMTSGFRGGQVRAMTLGRQRQRARWCGARERPVGSGPAGWVSDHPESEPPRIDPKGPRPAECGPQFQPTFGRPRCPSPADPIDRLKQKGPGVSTGAFLNQSAGLIRSRAGRGSDLRWSPHYR